MRILAVANRWPPWSLGGYEVLAASAVSALRAAGHDVRVLTTVPDPADERSSESPDALVHRELRWYWRDHQFPALGLRATVALERRNARVLERHLRALRPDVVLWWAMGGMSLSLLAQPGRAGVPAVGVVGDDWMLYGPAVDRWTRRWSGGRAAAVAPLAQLLTGVPTRPELARAARWIFISEHLRAKARAAGMTAADAVVAHPGVDRHQFSEQPAGPWRWRLLYCGRIDERKGIATAIEALSALPVDAQLTIDGHGNRRHEARLRAAAGRLGVSERVQFKCSSRQQVPAAYAAADAIAFPVEWEEPWGLVPLEAMAVGRPVVASRAGGGAAEYLRDEENCLQFPPGDAGALAAAVRRLEADQGLRARLVDGGRRTVARFTAARFDRALQRELELVGGGS